MFGEVNESVKAYGLGGHRHVAEIEQELAALTAASGLEPSANPGAATVDFVPHLIPMTRGHPFDLHVRPTRTVSQAELDELYADGVCGRAVRHGRRARRRPPSTSPGSNEVRLHVRLDERSGPDHRHRRRGQPGQGRRRPGDPGVQPGPRPAGDGRPRTTATGALTDMTAIPSERTIPVRSADLPAVERRAVIPAGFTAGGMAVGIKASGRPDLAVVLATDGPAAAAAVFTPNTFAAAPVRLSKAHLAATSGDDRGGFGWAQAIISTSGSANAATGPDGDADQPEVARLSSEATGVAIEHTLHLSTGVIGTRLPLEQGRGRASARSIPALQATDAGFEAAAEALRTTDSVTKAATTTIALPDVDGSARSVTVSGIAKGVGMIHPLMATMLSIVLTDAASNRTSLWGLLRPAAARTWDQLSVDGDTSTNDTVFVLASGASGAAPVRAGTAEAACPGRRDRGHRARPRPPAGRRRRGCGHAHHRVVTGCPRRRRCPGGRPGRHLVQPGQGRGPRT